VCISYLKNLNICKIALFANNGVRSYFISQGFETTFKNPEAAILTYNDDYNYQDLVLFINLIRKGVPYYATHIDYLYPSQNGLIPDIGCMIETIRIATGLDPIKTFGKPSNDMILSVLAKENMSLGDAVIVGDKLYTDVAMGTCNDLLTILVLSGETKREEYEESKIRADIVIPSVKDLEKFL